MPEALDLEFGDRVGRVEAEEERFADVEADEQKDDDGNHEKHFVQRAAAAVLGVEAYEERRGRISSSFEARNALRVSRRETRENTLAPLDAGRDRPV